MSEYPKLSDIFPCHTYEEWREVVDKQLKGAPFEKKLIKKTYEGIDIQPMYFEQDLESLPHIGALPGFAPFVRGTKALGAVIEPWLICQENCYCNPVEFNKAARADIKRGQNALNILLDKATLQGKNPNEAKPGNVGCGLSIATVLDATKAFEGIDLEEIPIYIQTGVSGLALTALIASIFSKEGKSTDKLTGCIAMDPLGVLSHEGELPISMESAYQEMAQLTTWARDKAPKLRTIGVNGHPYHNSGGSAVQELAFTAATGVEYIREMLSRGISIDDVTKRMCFGFSVGSDFFMEIAKLRAARLVWDKIVDAFGGDIESRRLNMHVRTSMWNKSVTDPYVNMLRVTTEAFAAICGGCDSLHVGAFDEAIRLPGEFSRRIARNVQVVLKDECHFDKVVDPAGGSWYVEVITDSIARGAWKLFQEVEDRGGMFKALKSCFPQEQLAETASSREKNINSRKDVFIGTNKYANLREQSIKDADVDYEALYKDRLDQVNQYLSSIDSNKTKAALDKMTQIISDDTISAKVVEEAVSTVLDGATLGDLTKTIRSKDSSKTVIGPLRIHRGPENFEALRRASDDYSAKTGSPLKIFLANMGPVSQHKVRADFSTGFFNVGGFEMIGNNGFNSVDDAASAAVESGAKVVVICSTDDTYPEIVPPLTKKIKEANPATIVILAGYPKDHVDAFKEAGVDDFIHIRANAFGILQNLQKRLGVIS